MHVHISSRKVWSKGIDPLHVRLKGKSLVPNENITCWKTWSREEGQTVTIYGFGDASVSKLVRK